MRIAFVRLVLACCSRLHAAKSIFRRRSEAESIVFVISIHAFLTVQFGGLRARFECLKGYLGAREY